MKKRILILDDEIDFTHIMKRVLEMSGQYQVRTTVSSSTFMDVAREYKPDLILLDCMMPALDGGQIAGEIQADPQLRNTPFMFLTATIDKPETQPSRCYEGLATYLPKSMEWGALFKVIGDRLSNEPAA